MWIPGIRGSEDGNQGQTSPAPAPLLGKPPVFPGKRNLRQPQGSRSIPNPRRREIPENSGLSRGNPGIAQGLLSLRLPLPDPGSTTRDPIRTGRRDTPENPSAVRKGGTPGIPLQGLIPHPQERQRIPADPSGSRESPILHPSGCGAAPRFPSRNKPWRQHGIPKIPLGAGIPELIQTQHDP